MLFNSYAFIFAFLPVALAGYQLSGRYGRRPVILWLGSISLVFYSFWRPAYVILLLASVCGNFLAARWIQRSPPNSTAPRSRLWLAIAANLAALGYYKYLFPLLGFFAHLTGHRDDLTSLLLPLGISFFTFTQIAHLVDLQQGAAMPEDFPGYLLFVTFFPHLIAGPILHHGEMMPQFREQRRYRLRAQDVAVGGSWFILGLAKKVLLADQFAHTANAVYGSPDPLGATLAWRGVLAYALQLYFDFSGYSDMACGLARMFSIDFPLNFASPYKSANIIDYWQRWHMTLTRYITTYLYNPLQLGIAERRMTQGKKVSRKALSTGEGFIHMLAVPTLLTFLITGIWHGAGVKYIVFGLLHGSYLTINHAWRIFKPKAFTIKNKSGSLFAVSLTFLSVVAAQTFFRAADCRQALQVLAGMAGHQGRGPLHLPGEGTLALCTDLALLIAGLVIVWAMPNTQEILSRYQPALSLSAWDRQTSRIAWRPSKRWAFACGAMLFLALVYLQEPSTFLYFQF